MQGMAKIKLSADAPQEAVHFAVGNDEFDLTAGGELDTDSAVILGEIAGNPWLEAVEVIEPSETVPEPTEPPAPEAPAVTGRRSFTSEENN